MDAQDTSAALIHDHPFQPRAVQQQRPGPETNKDAYSPRYWLQKNPALCAICRLAEAAHAQS